MVARLSLPLTLLGLPSCRPASPCRPIPPIRRRTFSAASLCVWPPPPHSPSLWIHFNHRDGQAASKLRIEFLYDIVSPYSALAWWALPRLEQAWGARVVPVPVFLGGIMKAASNKVCAAAWLRSLGFSLSQPWFQPKCPKRHSPPPPPVHTAPPALHRRSVVYTSCLHSTDFDGDGGEECVRHAS
jgi:hypothetical protein